MIKTWIVIPKTLFILTKKAPAAYALASNKKKMIKTSIVIPKTYFILKEKVSAAYALASNMEKN